MHAEMRDRVLRGFGGVGGGGRRGGGWGGVGEGVGGALGGVKKKARVGFLGPGGASVFESVCDKPHVAWRGGEPRGVSILSTGRFLRRCCRWLGGGRRRRGQCPGGMLREQDKGK